MFMDISIKTADHYIQYNLKQQASCRPVMEFTFDEVIFLADVRTDSDLRLHMSCISLLIFLCLFECTILVFLCIFIIIFYLTFTHRVWLKTFLMYSLFLLSYVFCKTSLLTSWQCTDACCVIRSLSKFSDNIRDMYLRIKTSHNYTYLNISKLYRIGKQSFKILFSHITSRQKADQFTLLLQLCCEFCLNMRYIAGIHLLPFLRSPRAVLGLCECLMPVYEQNVY